MLLIKNLLSKKGALLWYSDPMQRNKKAVYSRRFIDGYLVGEKRSDPEAFYVELQESDIETLIETAGLTIDNEYSNNLQQFTSNSIVYYAKPSELTILSNAINLQNFIDNGTTDTEGNYSTKDFPHILNYLEIELKTTPPGQENFKRYQKIIAYILKNLFDKQLTDMVIEDSVREGDQIIDITFRRLNQKGFFKDFKEVYSIHCPYIKIECKNLSDLTGDPKNKEFDQLSGNLNDISGMFGILVVRNVKNATQCIKHCKDRLHEKQENIMVLEDLNIFELCT